jgi:hypothetical protein
MLEAGRHGEQVLPVLIDLVVILDHLQACGVMPAVVDGFRVEVGRAAADGALRDLGEARR